MPATSAVAVSNGGPLTRSGGVAASMLKNSFDACTAEAAVSDVPASLPTASFSAVRRFVAVTSEVAPMVNSLSPGGVSAVAVSVSVCVVPSGKPEHEIDGLTGGRDLSRH